MAANGRTYELKARFSVESDTRGIDAFEKRLKKLKRTMNGMDKAVTVGFKSEGDQALNASIKNTEKNVDKLDGKTADVKIQEDRRTANKFAKTLDRYEKRLKTLSDEKHDIALDLENKAVERKLAVIERRMNSMTDKVYELRIEAEERGMSEIGRQAGVLERQLAKMSNRTYEARVQAKGFREVSQDFQSLERRAREVTQRPWEIDVRGDISDAAAKFKQIGAMARAESQKAYRIEMRAELVGHEKVRAQAAQMRQQMDRLAANRTRMAVELDGVPAVLAGFAKVRSAGQGAAKTYRVHIELSGAAVAAAGMAAVGAAGRALAGHFTTAGRASQMLMTVMRQLQGVIMVLGLAFVTVAVASIGPMIGGLGTLATSLLAAVSGFGLLAAAVAPVISAFSNMQENAEKAKTANNQLETASKSLASAQQAVGDAFRARQDAQISGEEQIGQAIKAHEDAIRGVQDAHRAYADAVDGLQQAQIDGERQVADAIRSHEDARRQTRQATQDLTAAQRELVRAYEDEEDILHQMSLDVEGMRLEQKQNTLDIAEAQKELNKARREGSSSEIQQAELNLERAQLRQRDLAHETTLAQDELNRQRAEGTDQFRSAQEGVVDAQEAVNDALRSEQDAQRAIGEAREQANRGVADAQKAVADAQRGIVDAVRAENEAQRGIEKARNDAARSMEDANRQVAQALKEVAAAQKEVGTAQAAVNALAAGLTPEMVALQKQAKATWNEFKEGTASARSGMIAMAIDGLQGIRNNMFDITRAANETGTAVSDAFGRVNELWQSNDVFQSIRSILQGMPEITGLWTEAIGNFGGAFLNLFAQIMPFARDFAEYIADVGKRFLEWTASTKGRRQIHEFFEAVAPVARAVRDVIWEIGGALISWSTQNPEKVADMIRTFGQILFVVAKAAGIAYNAIVWLFTSNSPWRPWVLGAMALYAALILIPGPILLMTGRLIMFIGRMAAMRAAAAGLGSGVGGVFRAISGGIANAAVRLVASFGGALRRVGQMIGGLRGRFARFASGIGKDLRDIPRGFAQVFQRITQTVGRVVQQITARLRRLPIVARATGSAMVRSFTQGFARVLQSVGRTITNIGIRMQRLRINAAAAGNGVRAAFVRAFNGLVQAVSRSVINIGRVLRGLPRVAGGVGAQVSRIFSRVFGSMGRIVGRAIAGIGRTIRGLQGTVSGVFRAIGGVLRNAGRWFGGLLRSVTGFEIGTLGSAGRVLAGFLRVFGNIVLVGEIAVRSLIEIFGFLVPMFRGLGRQLAIEGKGAGWGWVNGIRGVLAAGAMVLINIAGSIAKGLVSVMGWSLKLFGINAKSETERINRETTEQIKNWRANLYGETNMAAIEIGRNMGRGADAMSRETQRGGNAAKQNISGAAQQMQADIDRMNRQFQQDFNMGANAGIGATNRLKGQAGANINQMASQGMAGAGRWKNGITTNMNQGSSLGGAAARRLKTISMQELNAMLANGRITSTQWNAVVSAQMNQGAQRGSGSARTLRSVTVNETGYLADGTRVNMWEAHRHIADATAKARDDGTGATRSLEQGGTTAMQDAHMRWRDAAWSTAMDVQAALNAMILGVQKFIEATGITTEKPEPFQPFNAGNAGGQTGQHGGGPKNARGGVHKFARGGMAPVGGVSSGTTRVFGEVPGTTEFYITDNDRFRDRNMQILQQANEHMLGRGGKLEGEIPNGFFFADIGKRGGRNARGNVEKFQVGGAYQPHYNWAPGLAEKWAAIDKAAGGTPTYNNYYGHPYGWSEREPYSADFWGAGGQGDPIPVDLGNKVLAAGQRILGNALSYWIWNGRDSMGGSAAAMDAHTDHVHFTAMPGLDLDYAGMGGGTPAIDFNKEFNANIPAVPDIGDSKFQNMGEAVVTKMRDELRKMLQAETAKVSITGGNSPKGLTIGKVVDQTWPAGERSQAAAIIFRESGGNASAINDWDSNAAAGTPSVGLMQIIEPTARSVDPTATTEKLKDPLYNSSVGSRIQDAQGWGPWTTSAGWQNYTGHENTPITGYSNGGVAMRPHLGVLGDTGPEAFVPLDDPRAVSMIAKAVNTTPRVGASSVSGGTSRFGTGSGSMTAAGTPTNRKSGGGTGGAPMKGTAPSGMVNSGGLSSQPVSPTAASKDPAVQEVQKLRGETNKGFAANKKAIEGNKKATIDSGLKNAKQVTTAVKASGTAMKNQVLNSGNVMKSQVLNSGNQMRTSLNTMRAQLGQNVNQVKAAVDQQISAARSAIDNMRQGITAAQNSTSNYINNVRESVDSLREGVNQSAENTANLGKDVLKTATSTDELLQTTKKVWGLKEGGIITQPTRAIIGEGTVPEAVIPMDSTGSDLLKTTATRMGYDLVRRTSGRRIPAGMEQGSGGWMNWDLFNGKIATYDPRKANGTVNAAFTDWNKSAAAKILPNYGGRHNIKLALGHNPGGGALGMTYSDGRMQIADPNNMSIVSHETGHAYGLDHNSNNSIMNYDTVYSLSGPTGIDKSRVAGRFGRSTGYAPKLPAYGKGGMTRKAHVGMVGDTGDEAIIPLNDTRAQRAVGTSIVKGLSSSGVRACSCDSSGTSTTNNKSSKRGGSVPVSDSGTSEGTGRGRRGGVSVNSNHSSKSSRQFETGGGSGRQSIVNGEVTRSGNTTGMSGSQTQNGKNVKALNDNTSAVNDNKTKMQGSQGKNTEALNRNTDATQATGKVFRDVQRTNNENAILDRRVSGDTGYRNVDSQRGSGNNVKQKTVQGGPTTMSAGNSGAGRNRATGNAVGTSNKPGNRSATAPTENQGRRRGASEDGKMVAGEVKKMTDKITKTMKAEMKEIELGQKSLEKMYKSGFNTALKAMRSREGRDTIDDVLGQKFRYDKKLRGLR